MARLVLAVLAVCVLWWSWLVFSGAPAAAADPGVGESAAGRQLPLVPAAVRKQDSVLPKPLASHKAGEVANGDAKGAAKARGNGLQKDGPQGKEKDKGGRASQRSALAGSGAPPDVRALLARLGEGNAFLHSAQGRQVARRSLTLIHREPPVEAVVHSTLLLNLCMRGALGQGDLEARKLVDEIYQRHKPLVRRVVFDPERLDGARRHRVQAGETLGKIAARVRREGILVEPHTLALVNRISNPNLVRAGQLLKIPVRALKAVLEKRSFLMAIYLGDVMIRLYWVGHGAEDLTPETKFTVGAKLEHPDWYAPDGNRYAYGDPRNVLGDYFVKFEHSSYTGFGAHGTPDPQSIGKMASQGCIRMRDMDIREFFQIMPQGCQVEIRATE